jgi:hypothetical protein
LEGWYGDRHLGKRRFGRLTCDAVPALRKGRGRRGLGKTPGIRGWSSRQELRLGSKGSFFEALRQTLGLKIVKRAVGISIVLVKVSDWASWRSWPPPKRKKVKSTALEKEEMACACRLFGMNSLKEVAVWHVDLLLHNDRKMRAIPNSLKEGAMWHIDLLLRNDHKINSYTK